MILTNVGVFEEDKTFIAVVLLGVEFGLRLVRALEEHYGEDVVRLCVPEVCSELLDGGQDTSVEVEFRDWTRTIILKKAWIY